MLGVSLSINTEDPIADPSNPVTLKVFRLRAYLKFKQIIKKALLKARLGGRFSRGLKADAPKIAKRYSRH